MIFSLVLVLPYNARYIIQQDSKLPRKIYLLSQEGIFSGGSVSPADFLWTPPFTPMKDANGVFVLSVEHDGFA